MLLNFSKSTLIFILVYLFSSPSLASSSCSEAFSEKASPAVLKQAEKVSQNIALLTEAGLQKVGARKSSIKGYSILIGTMVGSAVVTTYAGSRLPSNLQFTSIFLSQITVLGVYVLGAPIWEPISSRFRQWAFGIKTTQSQENSRVQTEALEILWAKTQENYSLNAQMSRNMINQFLLGVKQNFYFAHRAYIEKNPHYSADQIAEAAFRMRLLFKEIEPTDPSVAAVIRSTFTNHIRIDSEFRELVWTKLRELDQQFNYPETQSYYEGIMATWLASQ